jgi:predicted small secreted protein
MKNQFINTTALLLLVSLVIFSCNSSSDIGEEVEETTGTLHPAFAEFDTDETTIYLSGADVVIETTGLPNHTTPYWSESHPLYIAPTITSLAEMTPTRIDTSGRDNSSSVTVSTSPDLASSTTATALGAIGVAVSGAYLYNDQEGNGALDAAAGSLDYSGAHIGPTDYHYHLEPLAFSDDDDKLNGIISDGFFIYGRKCNSTGTYPTNLDASGGHTSATQYTDIAEYHYHIINELYATTGRYIIFAGPYQGTPNAIN